MVMLRLVVPYVPFPMTWPIHFLFAFALTRLVYRNLMNASHTKKFFWVMVGLMGSYEIYWWFMGDKISGSVPITALDSVIDLGAGIAGTLVGMRTWRYK